MVDQDVVDSFKIGAAIVTIVGGGFVATFVVCCTCKIRLQRLARIANDNRRPEDEQDVVNDLRAGNVFRETTTLLSRFLRLCGFVERAERIERVHAVARRHGLDRSSNQQRQRAECRAQPSQAPASVVFDCARCYGTLPAPACQGCHCLRGEASVSVQAANQAKPRAQQAGGQNQETRISFDSPIPGGSPVCGGSTGSSISIGTPITPDTMMCSPIYLGSSMNEIAAETSASGRAANKVGSSGRQHGRGGKDPRTHINRSANQVSPNRRLPGREERNSQETFASTSASARPAPRPLPDSHVDVSARLKHAPAQASSTRSGRGKELAQVKLPVREAEIQLGGQLPPVQPKHGQAPSTGPRKSDHVRWHSNMLSRVSSSSSSSDAVTSLDRSTSGEMRPLSSETSSMFQTAPLPQRHPRNRPQRRT